MTEVTICISFSVKDGAAKHASKYLDTMIGSFGDGIKNTKSRSLALDAVFSLLKLVTLKSKDVYIHRPTLSEGRAVNTLDDLNTEIPTHAESEKYAKGTGAHPK